MSCVKTTIPRWNKTIKRPGPGQARTTIVRWNKTIEHTVQVQLSHGEMKRSNVPCEDNYRTVEEEDRGEG